MGGGPAGLYLGILLKLRDPASGVRVLERNRPDDTFGFGVVFSDATLAGLCAADPVSHEAITRSFWHWDAIDVHYRSEIVRSQGHGFAGMSRHKLLSILQARARELGVELVFGEEVTDVAALARECDLVVGADGVASGVRTALAADLEPVVDERPNRFTWLGTTRPFEAFSFYFEPSEHGFFRVHAYGYEPGHSTFIVECTEETFRRAGLDERDEDATVAYCERLFAARLEGHKLLKNRSIWRRFPTVRCGRWHAGNVVLLGDAAHTAHFSVGSGTKLAMEDAIALADALGAAPDVPSALARYERARRPEVESLQRAAQSSLEWFEHCERYFELEPLEFTFSLLTRSLRVTHESLKLRDPELVRHVDSRFAARAQDQTGVAVGKTVPPMFTPFRLRELVLENRVVVSPMCQYSAEDGEIGDWHLVHLGSRAVGGAGLVMTEMTDVSPEGRITPGCAGLYALGHAAAYRRVTDFVHKNTRAKIGVQLAHAGRKGSTQRMWEQMDERLPRGNWPLLAPSPLPYLRHGQVPKAMGRIDMDVVREAFVRATRLADEAGFDLVELHCAHGYLLGSFLSP
ncbi:MAG: FAD-dependent monooxygenase, partial [Myxococcales bacterium]|nr:FAD-dependent monooxygenase [Myxococcales bacterium]